MRLSSAARVTGAYEQVGMIIDSYGKRVKDGLVIKSGVTMVTAVDDKVDFTAARDNCL